ncbi:hypothetical protein ID866_6759 [Astraeus odoratus]|nr:hypothetical protein ID866_6759 [Astraeus odoratus]
MSSRSVSDSDGEFLLIEAADFLPSWVNPSNVGNRVWVYKGRLHLIPLSHVSAQHKQRKPKYSEEETDFDITGEGGDDCLAVDDALRLVRDSAVDTLAPKEVEDVVWNRIFSYPDAARHHVHTTKAYLPIDIAHALAADPSLVQKPVETFYTRDAIQLRVCSPYLSAYAQLMGQKFYPPKIFGQFEEPEGTTAWRWRDIGMKLACGFEMLYQESKNRATITAEQVNSSTEARKDALRRTTEYRSYISKLVLNGYFRDEVEGSKLWNEFENKASDVYVEALRTSEAARPTFATLFNTALSRAEETLPDNGDPEDSDEWMRVDASRFDDVLARGAMDNTTSKQHPSAMDVVSDEQEESWLEKEQSQRLRDLAAKIERFVEGEGDLEGARFEDEASSDDNENDADQDSVDQLTGSDDEGSVEESAQKTTSRQEAMAGLVPPLPPSEYGQMPASFNTQRVAKTTIETESMEVPSGTETVEEILLSRPAPRTRPIRPPLLPRDKFEGVDSDDESSSSDPLAGGDEDEYESEEDRPQVEGEMEIDMTEEQDEFIEFSRQTLGISDDMWKEIIQERTRRGVFVPKLANVNKAPQKTGVSHVQPACGPRPDANAKLDSFEAVMEAMDAQLEHLRQSNIESSSRSQTSANKSKGKGRASPPSDDLDIEATMEAELKQALEKGDTEDSEDENEVPMDYNLIKNFLESFKGQAGLSGPAGNLAGRLMPDWTIPRDET